MINYILYYIILLLKAVFVAAFIFFFSTGENFLKKIADFWSILIFLPHRFIFNDPVSFFIFFNQGGVSFLETISG